jgi:hypothetical protein
MRLHIYIETRVYKSAYNMSAFLSDNSEIELCHNLTGSGLYRMTKNDKV